MHLACMLDILPGWLSESLSLYSGQAVANLGWMLAIPIILLMLATPMDSYMVVSYGTCPPRYVAVFQWPCGKLPTVRGDERTHHDLVLACGLVEMVGGLAFWRVSQWQSLSTEWASLSRGSEASPRDLADLYCTAMDDGWLFSIIFWGGDSIGLRFCWICSRAVFFMSLHRKHSDV